MSGTCLKPSYLLVSFSFYRLLSWPFPLNFYLNVFSFRYFCRLFPPRKKTQYNPHCFSRSWCGRRIGNRKALGVIRDAWFLTAATYSRSIVAQIEEKPEPKEDKIGKTDNHIGCQNRKTASIHYENRKPDAKKRKIRKPRWTPKPKNRSVLAQKPKNRSKNSQNRKTENPNAPLHYGL